MGQTSWSAWVLLDPLFANEIRIRARRRGRRLRTRRSAPQELSGIEAQRPLAKISISSCG